MPGLYLIMLVVKQVIINMAERIYMFIQINIIMKVKRIIFSIYALLIFFIVLSCGKKDSYPPYYYTLQIRFTDQLGNDTVQGIKYIEDNKPGSGDEYKVQKDIYRLEVEQTHKPKEDLFLDLLRVQKVDLITIL